MGLALIPGIGSLGGTELIIALVIILLLFGAKRIPELARGLGSGVREFRAGTKEGQIEDKKKEEEKKQEEERKQDEEDLSATDESSAGASDDTSAQQDATAEQDATVKADRTEQTQR